MVGFVISSQWAPVLAGGAVVAAGWAVGAMGAKLPARLEDPVARSEDRHSPRAGSATALGAPPVVPPPSPALVAVVTSMVGAVAVAVGVPVAVGLAGLVGLSRLRVARHRRVEQQRNVEAAVPDLIDLFLVAAAAGHPVSASLRMVAPRSPVAVRRPLTDSVERLDRGCSLAEVLAHLGGQLGALGAALTGALAGSAATGSPLVPTLERVAVLARDRRRRAAEARARRLPVTMLFPLVACVLPAFVLLTVVPLLVASLGSLRL